MPAWVNDIHSQLNPTRVSAILRPQSLAELQDCVRRTPRLAVCGGRHAMGGQQFGSALPLLDLGALNRVLAADAERGLLHIEAGAQWPEIVAAARDLPGAWGIRQKQTGVDAVSLGGSMAANAHGRGLRMGPLADDIESFQLIDAQGELRHCSRTQDAELFSLVLGGYGLFGIVYSATLRLAPRQRLRRLVDVLDLDDALSAVRRRAAQGCVFGDFQFVIDAADPRFLRRGLLACYEPVETGGAAAPTPPDLPPDQPPDLPPEAWLRLLQLAHQDKAAAFRLYAQHYLGTDGQLYDSDTLQLATYIPSYADYLASHRDPELPKETLLIGEHYVPPEQLDCFMRQAQALLRDLGSEVIYGTIRAIQPDRSSFLPWARDAWACVVFNLRTPHDAAGQARSAAAFRGLIEAALDLGGSFFLTYHRHATPQQVLRGHPRFLEWLERKHHWDPAERFTSDWYRHYRQAFASHPGSTGA